MKDYLKKKTYLTDIVLYDNNKPVLKNGGPVLNDAASNIFRENVRLYMTYTKRSISYIAKLSNRKYNTLKMVILGERHKNLEVDIAEDIANALDIDLERLVVKLPLDLDLNILRFLQDEENQEKVKALMNYTQGNDKLSPYFNPRIQKILQNEKVVKFLSNEKKWPYLLELINWHNSAEEFKKLRGK